MMQGSCLDIALYTLLYTLIAQDLLFFNCFKKSKFLEPYKENIGIFTDFPPHRWLILYKFQKNTKIFCKYVKFSYTARAF